MSATQTVKLSVQSNARAYSDMIAQYAVDTGKSVSAALLREGPDFAIALYKEFRAIRPSPASIADDAKDRHYRMGRKGNNYTAAMDGLSVKARNAAYAAMGGDMSDLFRYTGNSALTAVRFSKREDHRMLLSKRKGLRASELTPEQVDASLSGIQDGVSRLNFRAVATYYEIIFRQRGAHGFLASQWLYKEWKRFPQFDAATGYTQLLADRRPPELVNRAANGKQTGKVEFETGASGNVENILLTGMVPGTAEQMQKHGILSRVATARIAALANAIKQHHAKVARQHKLN